MKHFRISASELPGTVAAPWAPKTIERFFIGALLATLTMLTFPNSAHAQLIGMVATPGSPVVNTNDTFIDYQYFGGGSGGVLTIEGKTNAVYGGAFDGKVTQDITVPFPSSTWGTANNGPFKIRDPQAEGTSDFGRTTYLLIANFDDFGVFTTGTVVVSGAVDSVAGIGDSTLQYINPLDPTLAGGCFQLCSGWDGDAVSPHGPATLLTSTLTGFGFKATVTGSGDYDALQMDWYMDMTGGDMFSAGFVPTGQRKDVGVIVEGLVTWGNGLTKDNIGSFPGGSWDPQDDNSNTTAFLQDFRSCDTGCDVLLQTFVPVPAAIWLFGSGLLGLTGVGMRNRRRNRRAG
ncbi:MAG: hypothetical protein V3S33_02705 [Gammaproteobacteria bacterium]